MVAIEKSKGSGITYLIDSEAQGVSNGNPWKGLVVAMLDSKHNEMIREIGNKLENTVSGQSLGIEVDWYHTKNFNSTKMTGIARCSIEDKFNVEVGKQLARERVLQKYYKEKMAILCRLHADMDNLVEALESQMRKTAHQAEKFGY